MPVLATETSAPRSALRYRPIHTRQEPSAPLRSRAVRARSDALMTAAPVIPDDLDREKPTASQPRRQTVSDRPRTHTRKRTRRKQSGRRFHPLFWLGSGLLVLLLLWLGVSQLIGWSTNTWNTLRYGTTRTFQIDAVVGQGDSAQHPSHFLALNLHGTIVVIDFPADDPSRARDFEITTLLGPNVDQEVVTLRFLDLQHTGKPDMLIDVGNVQSVLVNDKGTFRSPTPAEQQQMQRLLQQADQ